MEGFFCASGEPSTAIEHTFSLTPGGFTTHEVTPPSVPGRALSHEVEQWSRDLLDAYALRLFDAGVG